MDNAKEEIMKVGLKAAGQQVPQTVLDNAEANRLAHAFVVMTGGLLSAAPDDMDTEMVLQTFGNMTMDLLKLTVTQIGEVIDNG